MTEARTYKPGDRVIYGWTRRGIEYGVIGAGPRIPFHGRIVGIEGPPDRQHWVCGEYTCPNYVSGYPLAFGTAHITCPRCREGAGLPPITIVYLVHGDSFLDNTPPYRCTAGQLEPGED